MNVKLNKANPKGIIIPPSSKSYSHRYLLSAFLSNKYVEIDNVFFSNDIKATLDCIKSLGGNFIINENKVTFFPRKEISLNNIVLNCQESGSTLRFIIPIALCFVNEFTCHCAKRLIERGIKEYEDLFKKMNIKIDYQEEDIHISSPQNLKGGQFSLDCSKSSQYLTGLLFALPLLKEKSEIIINSKIESKDYINITLDVLKKSKINIKNENNVFYILPNQKYDLDSSIVEEDYSSLSNLYAFNYLNGNVKFKLTNMSSLQGDRIFFEYFEKINDGVPTLDIQNCIDLGPVLITLATLKNGAKFINTKRLKIKESSRGEAIKEELSKIGADIKILDNEIIVNKSNLHKSNQIFSSHNDHRIIMALSLLISLFDIEISNCEAIYKSYPNYFDDLKKLGVNVTYE